MLTQAYKSQGKRFKDSGVPIYGMGVQSHFKTSHLDMDVLKVYLTYEWKRCNYLPYKQQPNNTNNYKTSFWIKQKSDNLHILALNIKLKMWLLIILKKKYRHGYSLAIQEKIRNLWEKKIPKTNFWVFVVFERENSIQSNMSIFE